MSVRIVIDHCVIAVSDWERSNAFYRDVLGAEVDQQDSRFGHYVAQFSFPARWAFSRLALG